MSTAENIEFIRRQISTFKAADADHARVLTALSARRASVVADVHDYRKEIRAARDALTGPNSAPSAADIAKRIVIQQRIDEIAEAESLMGLLHG